MLLASTSSARTVPAVTEAHPDIPDTDLPRPPAAADPHQVRPLPTTRPAAAEQAAPGTDRRAAPSADARPRTGTQPVHRSKRGARAVLALVASSALTLFGTGAYLAGQQSVTTAPGEVRVVKGSAESLGYAVDVFKAAHESVVRVSVDGGGVGSGFFYAPHRIVTNAHVVLTSPAALRAAAERKTFTVDLLLADGRQRTGVVIAADSRIDLAVIKVEEDLDVPALAFSTSRDVVTGQPVTALGYPFGGELMLTTGVISGVSTNSRFAESDAQTLLLQSDAAVNPGNSGGPLLDASGAVLGVVTLRPDEADGRQVTGMTLALPSDVAAAALKQLERSGEVEYPVVGVLLTDATADSVVNRGAVVLH